MRSLTPEGLKFLIRLCTDLGLAKEAQDYAVKLKKVEKVSGMCMLCCVGACCCEACIQFASCLVCLLPCPEGSQRRQLEEWWVQTWFQPNGQWECTCH